MSSQELVDFISEQLKSVSKIRFLFCDYTCCIHTQICKTSTPVLCRKLSFLQYVRELLTIVWLQQWVVKVVTI